VSLVAYIFFLRRYLRVAWWLAVPALLAVPLVQAHATSTYVGHKPRDGRFGALTFLACVRPAFIGARPRGSAARGIRRCEQQAQLIPLVASFRVRSY
jgi:hypothetical protein